MKKVYTCFCIDIIHEGHLNIIRKSQKIDDELMPIKQIITLIDELYLFDHKVI